MCTVVVRSEVPRVSPKVFHERRAVGPRGPRLPRAEGAPDMSTRNLELSLLRSVHAREAVLKFSALEADPDRAVDACLKVVYH